jgi:poly(A) polymerase
LVKSENANASNDGRFYSGRWVAYLRGRIIAQGGTPEQALRAAQSRYKETPEIKFMPVDYPLNFPPVLERVREALPPSQSAYLVGGAVRDAMLGRPIHDLDLILERDGIKNARRMANSLQAGFYPLDPERDTGRVIVTSPDGTRFLLDFASQRGTDLEADLRGRDFTINAIAINLWDDTILDPLGGMNDLQEERLRACSVSAFENDPVRILRGVRLASNFGFHILPETRQAMKAHANLLDDVSPERLRDELLRLLEGRQPATCLQALDMLGALSRVLPELCLLKKVEQPAPHVHDVWEHTLATLDHLETLLGWLAMESSPQRDSTIRREMFLAKIGGFREQINAMLRAPLTADRSLRSLVFLAALYHDVGKPQASKIDEQGQLRFWDHDRQGAEIATERAKDLAMSNGETTRIATVIQNHMRILYHVNRLVGENKPPSRRAIYRFFRDTGAAGVDTCLLALADLEATYEQELPHETWAAALEVVRMMLENWFEKRQEAIDPVALVNGDDLMSELGLQPGQELGALLEAIREAQAMGKVATREQALQLAREELEGRA